MFKTPVASDTMTPGVLWSATNKAEQFIVHTPFPTVVFKAFSALKRLMGSPDRVSERHCQVYCP